VGGVVTEGDAILPGAGAAGDRSCALRGAARRDGPSREATERIRRCHGDGDFAPFDGNTWRAIYTVRFRDAVYVLHAFQKKSKSGIATPKAEIALIHQRLTAAEQDYERRKS
jgi:hypothetical protein